MTIAFESKEELVLYYSITDNLNNVIEKITSDVIMEKTNFKETINEVVRCARGYQLYLSTGIEDFGK
jgi:hypothetical protein